MIKKVIKYLDKKVFLNFFSYFYSRILIKKSNNFLKEYPYLEVFIRRDYNDEFSKLCEKYITDKGGLKKNSKIRKFHFYSSYYHEKFKNKKNDIKLIFECGIGSSDKTIQSNIFGKSKSGASLRVFKDYFPNAEIYGGDIDKSTLFEEDRIKTYYIDQLNKDSIINMWKEVNKENFDLIIDDGMHTLESSYELFIHSFPKLKINGLYIIEDVHIAYLKSLTSRLIDYKPKIVTSKNKNKIDEFLVIIKKI